MRKAHAETAPPTRDTVVTTALTIGALATLAVCGWLVASTDTGGPPEPTAAQSRASADPTTEADAIAVVGGATPAMPASTPLRLRVPAIDVDTSLTGYGLAPDGSLQVPPESAPDHAGWYHGGVTPGTDGTALVAGHVDSATGPAVFYSLGALSRGDTIEVDRADGSTAVFTVDGVEVFHREEFPDELVYGYAGRPELRLITCGGQFSRAGGWNANVVVFAYLTDTR
ncbi:class F sortase [Streptomyces calidiresistens]